MNQPSRVTAGVLLIGDELLSGRTRDSNLQDIAAFIGPLGVQVAEARVVSDDQDAIVAALNALRAANDYVFTTGGIGPTHDDITADAVAAAFHVSIDVREDALAILQERYAAQGQEITPARLRMARIPDGATLIVNPVSGAPGFQIENVFVLAGVPEVMRGMLHDVGPRLEGGVVMASCSLSLPGAREGDIAAGVAKIQSRFDGVMIGSYPFFRSMNDYGVALVARSADEAKLAEAERALGELAATLGLKSA